MDSYQGDWLRQSVWDPTKDNVLLIHGYAGGDDTLPIVVLRDGKVDFVISFFLFCLLVLLFHNSMQQNENKSCWDDAMSLLIVP